MPIGRMLALYAQGSGLIAHKVKEKKLSSVNILYVYDFIHIEMLIYIC